MPQKTSYKFILSGNFMERELLKQEKIKTYFWGETRTLCPYWGETRWGSQKLFSFVAYFYPKMTFLWNQIKSNHVYCDTDEPIHILNHTDTSSINVMEPPFSFADQAARLDVSIIWNTSTWTILLQNYYKRSRAWYKVMTDGWWTSNSGLVEQWVRSEY
jgi:hypothetical protein